MLLVCKKHMSNILGAISSNDGIVIIFDGQTINP